MLCDNALVTNERNFISGNAIVDIKLCRIHSTASVQNHHPY